MSACCHAAGERKARKAVRRAREVFAWLFPSVLLVLMPKCPVCLAAYVTLWTGLGLSLVTATWLRAGLLLLCVVALLFLIAERLHRTRIISDFFKRETEQCHTKL